MVDTIVDICSSISEIGNTILSTEVHSMTSLLNLYKNISSLVPIVKKLAEEENQNIQNYLQELLVLSREIEKYVLKVSEESDWLKFFSSPFHYIQIMLYDKKLNTLKRSIEFGINVSKHQLQTKIFDHQVQLRHNISSVFQNMDEEVLVWNILRRQQDIFEERLSNMEETNLAQLLDRVRFQESKDHCESSSETKSLAQKMELMYLQLQHENHVASSKVSLLEYQLQHKSQVQKTSDDATYLQSILTEIARLEATFETMEEEHNKILLEQENDFIFKKAPLESQLASMERKIQSQQDTLVTLQTQKNDILQQIKVTNTQVYSMECHLKKLVQEDSSIREKYFCQKSSDGGYTNLRNAFWVKKHNCNWDKTSHNCWQQYEPTEHTSQDAIIKLRAWQDYSLKHQSHKWKYTV